MTPSEENCRDCPFFLLWPGNYGGPAGYPACGHPSLPRMALLDDGELDECPR